MPRDRIDYGIYSWQFVSIAGTPQIPSRQLKVVKMPGVWGKSFKVMSQEAPPARLTLTAVAINQADEEAWIASMAELAGRPVSVYSSTGVAYHNQIVHSVRHVSGATVVVGAYQGVSLGSTGRLLVFEMDVEYPFGV
jgi:hypothetical protein